MHEMSFAVQIFENVAREAGRYPGSRVVRIRLRAGEALAVEPASLRFCLEAISMDTSLEGAAVEVVEEPMHVECPQCGRVPVALGQGPVCPECGSSAPFAQDTALTIEEIELDDEEGQT